MKQILAVIVISFFTVINVSVGQEISMKPGFFHTKYFHGGERVSRKEMKSIILADKEAGALYRKSQKHMIYALVSLVAELGFATWGGSQNKAGNDAVLPLVGVLVSAASTIGFSISSSNLMKDAYSEYNSKQELGYINLGVTYNGLGLVYSF